MLLPLTAWHRLCTVASVHGSRGLHAVCDAFFCDALVWMGGLHTCSSECSPQLTMLTRVCTAPCCPSPYPQGAKPTAAPAPSTAAEATADLTAGHGSVKPSPEACGPGNVYNFNDVFPLDWPMQRRDGERELRHLPGCR